MTFTFSQHGPVALIFQDGKAICVAQLEDGRWTVNTDQYVGDTHRGLHAFRPRETTYTLEEMVARANHRAARAA